MKTSTLVSLLALLIASSAGCAGHTTNSPTPKSSVSEAPVPENLVKIEEAAEDAYDRALQNRADLVAANADAITSTWATFRAEAQEAGATEAALAATDAAVGDLQTAVKDSQDANELARASNAVSGSMPALFRAFPSSEPPEELSLDYLGREVVLDARQADFSAATAHTDEIVKVFAAIRDRLVSEGGATVTAEYESTIAATRSDIEMKDAALLAKDSNIALELVDEMEDIFARKNPAEPN